MLVLKKKKIKGLKSVPKVGAEELCVCGQGTSPLQASISILLDERCNSVVSKPPPPPALPGSKGLRFHGKFSRTR